MIASFLMTSSSNTGLSKFPRGDEWNTPLNETNVLEGSAMGFKINFCISGTAQLAWSKMYFDIH